MSSSPTPLFTVLPQHQAVPHTPNEAALVSLYDSGPFGATHSIRDGVRIQSNMVMSVDGALSGTTGSSRDVSNRSDMRVLSVIRSLADAVIVGASTVRAEHLTRLSPKPHHTHQRASRGQAGVPTLAIVSASGRVDWQRLDERGTSPVILFTSATDPAVLADARAHADEVVRGDTSPAAVAVALISRGHRRLVCEGGPTLLGQWVASGWIDEMCVTVTPRLIGDPDAPRLLGSTHLLQSRKLELRSVLTDSTTFMYRFGLRA